MRGVLDELKPGVEMWWEPWEFTAAQTYAVAERLDPRITLSLHSSIHEVYYVNQPDLWLRHLCRLAADRGTGVIVELFLSGAGEDLGPVPSYPCPRLVIEQLRSVAELPGVVGVKEYFGTVAEHISVNERAWREFLRRPKATDEELLTSLAAEFWAAIRGAGDALHAERVIARSGVCDEAISSQAGDCFGPNDGPRNDTRLLLAAWEEAARAVEVYPWDVSWRLRHYNSVRYDQQLGQGYWSRSFTASLPTPWTTPSWESSRGAAYIVYLSTSVVNPRLIEETGQRLERCVAHLDRALSHLAAIGTVDSAELTRQTDSLRIFRHLTLSRLYHLRASQLAAILRDTPALASATELEACLRTDHSNALALLDLVRRGGYHGFDLPCFEQSVVQMAAEVERYRTNPAEWVQTHLVDHR